MRSTGWGRNLLGDPKIFLKTESIKTWLGLEKIGNWMERFVLLFWSFLCPCKPSLAPFLHKLHGAVLASIS